MYFGYTQKKMAQHNQLGKWGEERACRYLEEQGYSIRERDFAINHKDLDIVAISPDETELVFIEVKTRTSDDFISPLQAINRKKILNLMKAANAYIQAEPRDYNIRFDIITIVGTAEDNLRIEHIPDAFNPLLFI